MLEHANTYTLMLRICCLGIVIDAMERLATSNKYRDTGLYSWVVLRQRLALFPSGVRRLADALFRGAERLKFVLVLRLAAAGPVVLADLGSPWFSAGLTVLVLTQLYVLIRTAGFGSIGADAMVMIICGGTWLATVVDDSPMAASAGLYFIAAQVSLGYVVAGVSKLRAPKWRSGAAIVEVLSTHTYGNPRLHDLVSARPRLAAFLCWGAMLWETTFPVVLVLPKWMAMAVLAGGIFFHSALAALMGLNLFLFAYPATYVAVWAIRSAI